MSKPDRIWITSNGLYSKIHKTRPAGEASTEYARVRDVPAAAAPAPDPKKAPKRSTEVRPAEKRQISPRLNRELKPRVTKEKA